MEASCAPPVHPPHPRGDRLTAAAHALPSGGAHEPGNLVRADLPAGPGHRVVHLPDAVDAVVLRVDPAQLRGADLISQGPR